VTPALIGLVIAVVNWATARTKNDNPEAKTLVVHRWEPKGSLIVLTAAVGDVVRAEPFEAIELRIDVMFGDEDNDD
jgi:hypothetical protein